MDREEAANLAATINATPGWHARVYGLYWSGTWAVYAWLGGESDDEENAYSLPFPAAWWKLRDGIAANGGI